MPFLIGKALFITPGISQIVYTTWEKVGLQNTLLTAGFTLILRGVHRDPGRTVQLSVDRGNDSESLNVQDDGISSARFCVMTLSTGMILKEIWMRYEPISLVTLEETCVHCFLHTCIYLFN